MADTPALILPTTAGQVFGATQWTMIRDLLARFRDGVPTFKGQLEGPATFGVVETSALTLFGGRSAPLITPPTPFRFTPEVNVGGWACADTGAEPVGVVVPTDGVYLVTAWANWQDDGTGLGRRVVQPQRNRAGIAASVAEQPPSPGTARTRHEASAIVQLAAGDELHVAVLQSAGFVLLADVYLSARWITA